jgi:16S rRNA (guanine966-N2)-methyltransferase
VWEWHYGDNEMRIITGKFKGRSLTTVEDMSIRPVTDRVKGSIFNMLQNRLDLRGIAVLDLFAGSGSLGFEALSRGSSRVVFVDDDPHALDAIEENAEHLDCIPLTEMVQSDAFSFIGRSMVEPFSLIFADPPYAYERTPEIPTEIFQRQLLKKEGFLIIEHDRRTTFPPSPLYSVAVERQFGNTHVSFFTHPHDIVEGRVV